MNKQAQQIAADLAKVVRGEVFGDIVHRAAYSTDASIYRILPRCVVAPRDAADVAAVIKYAAAEGIPVAARGAGTGLAGEALCAGIVFDMSRHMTAIMGVDNDGQTVTCEPGVVLDDLNRYLARFGSKIGPDPSSANRAVVGACVANNSTGSHSLQFGYMSAYVEAIEAVLADGSIALFTNDLDPEQSQDDAIAAVARECKAVLSANQSVIEKAQPATKRNRSGYNIAGICHNGRIDMARLLAGSEGTLAIFTRITLRTVPVPPAKGLLQLEFDSLEKMAEAVPAIVDSGAATCELMDKGLIDMAFKALPEYRDVLPASAAAVLLIEHVGQTEQQVTDKIERTDAAVRPLAAGRRIVLDAEQQKRLWKSRKDAGPLLYRKRRREHPEEFMEDVSVDYRRLGDYLAGLQEIAKRYDFEMFFFGHAGDGELHMRPFLDLSEPADVEKMRMIAQDVFSLAWSLGGSISGEHADGLVRAAFLRQQYGDEYYQLLCKIKTIFDPHNVMNPGKIINSDPDVMVRNLKRARKMLPERLRTDLLFETDELALEIEQCYGCGLCLSKDPDLRMCPVFRAAGGELAGSRAKANMLHFWATGQLDEKDFQSPEFRKFLDMCVNCKACLVQCPSGVDISTLMMAARAQYAKSRGLRRPERILSHNRHMSVLGGIFSPVSNLAMRLPVVKMLLEKTAGIDKRRSMPRFTRGSFLKAGRKYLASCAPIERPVDKVAYFVDTYANRNDHDLGLAVLEVLRHNDIDVILPKQLPAPLPAIAYGDVARAKKDLSYNVRHLSEAVRAGYKIVCSEPSAALTLKQELRHFVSGEDAKLVSENTYELMNYLLDLHKQGKLKTPAQLVRQEFVHHPPCHLCAVGSETASTELLHELCGAKVTDLKAGCCGIAGTFGMQKKNYDLSSRIASGLKEALEKSPTRNVLTECAACKMQIEHLSDCAVSHPIKILAACSRSAVQ
ncbi:MAG: anaerobic glycerol-3-phosphate dehydrogenase subunit C [Phycisphaerales bacterium]|nr:MAG: anaerobic glycerol-3-phosphate dehydrogenase subunit C [Phycisphaerales bacterium]